MNRIILMMLLCISYCGLSQVVDDFDDGNLNQNPTWIGDQQLFIVNSSNQLQLNDTEESITFLSTGNTSITNTEWRLWIKLSFSPSANNNARYYLVSDNPNLLEPLNGYYLQFGESGSSDAVELFRQDGTEIVSLCRGTEGQISSSFDLRVKVVHDENGNWSLFVDPNGGEDFVLEAEAIDNTFTQTTQLGFVCKYTKSNSTKMYFDDVYAGPIIVDTIPPILQSVLTESDSSLILKFDEVLDIESIEKLTNYIVNQGIGNPIAAARDEDEPSLIKLVFNSKFESGLTYLLEVSGVMDLSENIMIPTQQEFCYYVSQQSDIIINEIMADPNPQIGLPEFEYIELANQTLIPIDLEGWKLLIGSSEKEFSSVIIEPNGFLIIGKETAYEELKFFGDFFGFSSFSLTNTGQTILLQNDAGIVISDVSYSKDWYQDPEKEEGGWSLELKNPYNICSGGDNWEASVDLVGGTPGKVNSVADNNILFPEIREIVVIFDNVVQLYFNQIMDISSMSNVGNYSVSSYIGNPEFIYTFDDDLTMAELHFEDSFNFGFVYELTINSSILNCIQIEMNKDTVISFGLSESPGLYDLVINEVLFNPWTEGDDYVELYNRSDKVIDLSNIIIGSVKSNPPNEPDTILCKVSDRQKLLMPANYVVTTNSHEKVKEQYFTINQNAFLEVDPFPSYNNDKGHVIILSNEKVIVDTFSYSEKMHFPLLIYNEGVSLERNNPDVNISTNSNWHSAAESVGFGTPGCENSQYISEYETNDEIIIEPEIFSPDNDGVDDIMNIRYKFDNPGNVMSVTVLNSNGAIVRKLIHNEYIGVEGSISWDGIRDDNSKAPIGIYIFYITIYDDLGTVKKFRKTGVLASKL